MSRVKAGCSASPMSSVSGPLSAKAEVFLGLLPGNSEPWMPMSDAHVSLGCQGNRNDPLLLCDPVVPCPPPLIPAIHHLLACAERVSEQLCYLCLFQFNMLLFYFILISIY